jgi:UDP-N-acetylglucosamine 2-epimerase
MKLISIVGVRPEFVQAAPISRALAGRHREIMVHTGQHYDFRMSEVFFRQLGLPAPDYNLEVGSGTHAWQTGQMLIRLEEVLASCAPDCVVVRGDTNSTLAAALATAKLCIPLVHVEAGLRSFDRTMPEEINRLLTDRVSDILFCPTGAAVRNLANEGIVEGVYQVGDVMYDGLLHNLELARATSHLMQDLGLAPLAYCFATVHREGNTDNEKNLRAILDAFGDSGELIVFPAHPRTRKRIEALGCPLAPTVRLVDPVDHFGSLLLQSNARLVLTDSGGVQKEAYCLGKPCVTLRENTEWVETVEAGWNILAGADRERIGRAIRCFQPPTTRPPLYGDGHAAEKIVEILERRLI